MELTANKMEPYTMVRLVTVIASGRKTVQATNANQRLMTTGTSSKTNRRTMTTFPVLRRHSLSKVFPHHLTTSTSSPKPINRTTFHERRNRKVARVFSKKPDSRPYDPSPQSRERFTLNTSVTCTSFLIITCQSKTAS